MTTQDVISVPTRPRSIFWVPALCLALALIAYAYINYITPLAGDMWHYAILKHNRPFHDYLVSYYTNNPRVGELLLQFALPGDLARMLIQIATLAYFLFVAAWLVVGPLRKNGLYAPLVALVVLAVIPLSMVEPGQTLYYVPRTANYVFGYALILSFLIPYRLDLGGHRFRRPLLIIAFIVPMGLLAGMSNEQTVPAHLFVLSLLLVYATVRNGLGKADLWKYAGLASLLIGYLFLFFAPSEAVRHGGAKYDGLLVDPITMLTNIAGSVAYYLVTDVLSLIVILLLYWLYLRNRPRRAEAETRAGLILVGYLVATSILIVLTIALIPVRPARLYFPASVNLVLVAAYLAYDAVRQSEMARTAFQYGAAAVTAVFFVACLAFYQDVHGQFLQRVEMIKAQKAAGKKRIALPAYEFEWWPANYFMRDEGFTKNPEFHRNRFAAKYFGVKSVRLVR